MKTLAMALSAAAVAALLSSCAYHSNDRYDTYGYRYGYAPRYAYRVPTDSYYYLNGRRYSCRYEFDSRFCS